MTTEHQVSVPKAIACARCDRRIGNCCPPMEAAICTNGDTAPPDQCLPMVVGTMVVPAVMRL